MMMKVLNFLFLFLPLMAVGQNNSIAWQNFSFGAPALKVTLPGKPEAQSSNLPQSVKNYIKRYDAFYVRDDARGIVVTMMHLTYTDDVVADPNGAIEGTNGQWESTGTRVAILNTTEAKVSGKKSLQQRGKLIMGGQEHDYMDVVVVDGSRLWQVVVMTKTGDASLKTVMQKITDSISF
jgi:hypothetical protein